jgi:hypothetical protein
MKLASDGTDQVAHHQQKNGNFSIRAISLPDGGFAFGAWCDKIVVENLFTPPYNT